MAAGTYLFLVVYFQIICQKHPVIVTFWAGGVASLPDPVVILTFKH